MVSTRSKKRSRGRSVLSNEKHTNFISSSSYADRGMPILSKRCGHTSFFLAVSETHETIPGHERTGPIVQGRLFRGAPRQGLYLAKAMSEGDLEECYLCSTTITASEITQAQAESMERALKQIPRQYLEITKGIFCWSMGAVKPITGRELVEALALKDNPEINPENNEDVIRKCKEVIRVATGGLVAVEADDSSHLVDAATKEYILGGSSAYSISSSDIQEHLALSCWSYSLDGNTERDLGSRSEHSERRSIARYMIQHCVTHTRLAEEHGKAAGKRILELMEGKPTAVKRWRNEYSKMTSSHLSDEETTIPLLFCARFGFYKTAKLLLDTDKIDNSEIYQEKAREIALAYGHEDIALLLLSVRPLQSIGPLRDFSKIVVIRD